MKLTWIEDNDRFKTSQFRLIDIQSLYLQTQLGHDAIEYLHNAGLHRHIAAKCVVRSEAHLLWLDGASLEGSVGIPSIVLDVLSMWNVKRLKTTFKIFRRLRATHRNTEIRH